MAANFKGTGILWGIGHLSIGSGSLSASCSFQSADYDSNRTKGTIQDCNGDTMTVVRYDKVDTLNASYVFKSGTNTGTATVTFYNDGDIVTVTDTSVPQVAGTYQLINPKVAFQNKDATVVTCTLERHEGITYS